MKKHIYAGVLFLLAIGGLQAQNLFPNHSFENFANCPPSFYGSQPLDVFDWQRATSATPDYYTDAGACTLPLFMGTASDGNGFIRVLAYHNLSAIGYANGVWAEKIKAALVSDISPGCTYELSVDLALKPGPVNNLDKFDIGFYFYNGALNPTGSGCLSATPQVTFPLPGLTTNWANFTVPVNFATDYDSVVVGLFCNANSYQGDYISGPNIKIDDIHLEAIDSTCCECEVLPDFSYCVKDCEVCFTNETSTSSCTQLTAWSWSFGDGTNSNTYSPCHTYTTAGVHEVCLSAKGSTGTEACKKKHCTKIYIDEVCEPCTCSVESKFINSAVGINGCIYQFTALSKADSCTQIIEYQWSFGDGTSATTQTTSVWHTFSSGGNYNICLTTIGVSGKDTCKEQVCQNFSIFCGIIHGGGDVKKRVLSPGGIPVSEAAVQKAEAADQWEMFPNPVSDLLTIKPMENSTQFQIAIIDANGKSVLTKDVQQAEGPVELSMKELPAGTYLVSITTPEGARSVKTLVKQ